MLEQACSLRLGHPELIEVSQADKYFSTLLKTGDVTLRLATPLRPPSLFAMLKWKSVEHGNNTLVRWRDVVAFCNVVLKRYARVIGRCLQVLTKALYLNSTTFGFPLMLGTRDFAQTCIRLSAHTTHVHVVEKDMQDMYWEIPKSQVLDSFNWAVRHMGDARRHRVTYFAIHRGGDRMLDRMGKGSEDQFWNVPVSFVYQYVHWELFCNTLFTLGPLILEQGKAGVPIGGCLSAPQSEIRAIWCEHMSLHEETEAFQSRVRSILERDAIQASVVVPGPSQFTPLQGQGDFVRFDGVWAHSQRRFAPDKARHHGHKCPASSFWAPSKQLIAWVTIQGQDFPIVYSTAWDGAALGRTEAILQYSPRRDRRLLTDFFAQFNLADFVIHEIFCPQHHNPLPIPCAVVSRFKDNVPMGLIHVPPGVQSTMMQVLPAFLEGLYQIGLKWEDHGDVAQLCECEIVPASPIFLQRKGIVLSLAEELRSDFEWQRWLPVSSPNAKQVLSSTFPALMHKSLLYCTNREGFVANVRLLVWGAGWHNYPPDWWKASVKGFLMELSLTATVTYADIDLWFHEGKEYSGRHNAQCSVTV